MQEQWFSYVSVRAHLAVAAQLAFMLKRPDGSPVVAILSDFCFRAHTRRTLVAVSAEFDPVRTLSPTISFDGVASHLRL